MSEQKQLTNDKSIWFRLLYMLLFAVVLNIVEVLVFITAVVQFVIKAVNGSVNERLASFGASLGIYARQLIEFLTFASDEHPFPFADWPR